MQMAAYIVIYGDNIVPLAGNGPENVTHLHALLN